MEPHRFRAVDPIALAAGAAANSSRSGIATTQDQIAPANPRSYRAARLMPSIAIGGERGLS